MRELAAGNRLELWRRADADRMQLFHISIFVTGEFGGGDAPIANPAFFVRSLRSAAASATAAMASAASARSGGIGMISN